MPRHSVGHVIRREILENARSRTEWSAGGQIVSKTERGSTTTYEKADREGTCQLFEARLPWQRFGVD